MGYRLSTQLAYLFILGFSSFSKLLEKQISSIIHRFSSFLLENKRNLYILGFQAGDAGGIHIVFGHEHVQEAE